MKFLDPRDTYYHLCMDSGVTASRISLEESELKAQMVNYADAEIVKVRTDWHQAYV